MASYQHATKTTATAGDIQPRVPLVACTIVLKRVDGLWEVRNAESGARLALEALLEWLLLPVLAPPLDLLVASRLSSCIVPWTSPGSFHCRACLASLATAQYEQLAARKKIPQPAAAADTPSWHAEASSPCAHLHNHRRSADRKIPTHMHPQSPAEALASALAGASRRTQSCHVGCRGALRAGPPRYHVCCGQRQRCRRCRHCRRNCCYYDGCSAAESQVHPPSELQVAQSTLAV
mmetsp:Transcript_4093/g.9255  ORF Transcript_4093/g.9255 Transcript_4093/m.9255 type:complete len:235 (+) Transcript_4093:387-1091(+)